MWSPWPGWTMPQAPCLCYGVSLDLCYGVNIDRYYWYYCQQLQLISLVSNIADFPGRFFCNGAGCMGSETLMPWAQTLKNCCQEKCKMQNCSDVLNCYWSVTYPRETHFSQTQHIWHEGEKLKTGAVFQTTSLKILQENEGFLLSLFEGCQCLISCMFQIIFVLMY